MISFLLLLCYGLNYLFGLIKLKKHMTVFFSSIALNDTKSFFPNCDLTVGVLFCLALN